MIRSLDHLVITARDVAATIRFYVDFMGMEEVTFGPDPGTSRKALRFGNQKINLHQAGAEFEPKADVPTPGSADLCFLTDMPVAEVTARAAECGVEIIEGPGERTGAVGTLLSVYCRDPDGNLIEISNAV